jgi:hypothetical protein
LGFDDSTETVEAEFGSSGAVWKYWPIKRSTFEAVLNAESIGKSFNRLIHDVAENSKQVS